MVLSRKLFRDAFGTFSSFGCTRSVVTLAHRGERFNPLARFLCIARSFSDAADIIPHGWIAVQSAKGFTMAQSATSLSDSFRYVW